MNDFDVKTCVLCHIEKNIHNFYNKNTESKPCNSKRVLKRYYDNKEGILQQRRYKYSRFKDLDNRMKAVDEKLSISNDLT